MNILKGSADIKTALNDWQDHDDHDGDIGSFCLELVWYIWRHAALSESSGERQLLLERTTHHGSANNSDG